MESWYFVQFFHYHWVCTGLFFCSANISDVVNTHCKLTLFIFIFSFCLSMIGNAIRLGSNGVYVRALWLFWCYHFLFWWISPIENDEQEQMNICAQLDEFVFEMGNRVHRKPIFLFDIEKFALNNLFYFNVKWIGLMNNFWTRRKLFSAEISWNFHWMFLNINENFHCYGKMEQLIFLEAVCQIHTSSHRVSLSCTLRLCMYAWMRESNEHGCAF